MELDLSGTVLPPPTLTIADLLSTREVLLQREGEDKRVLESIGQVSLDTVRSKLIRWAVEGFPNNYVLQTITIVPPAVCSDGVSRGLSDYIEFCSGKSLTDQLTPLQSMLPDITVAFSFRSPAIDIVVLKA